MKIIKTKEIIPKDVSEISDSSLIFFKNRAKLINGSMPDFFVYIQDDAWEAFNSHGNNVYKELKHEAQGIFTGHYFKDQFGEFVVATAYEEGNGNSQSAYVEMSEECLANISERCQKNDTLMLIWVHTHPGFGVFYSGTDYNCLKTNFHKPYQIGIVVDILRNQTKGFKIKGSEAFEFANFRLFNNEKNLLFFPYQRPTLQPVFKNSGRINQLTTEKERLKKDLQIQMDENAELRINLKQKEDELKLAQQSKTDINLLDENLRGEEGNNDQSVTEKQQETGDEIIQLRTKVQNNEKEIEDLKMKLRNMSSENERLKKNHSKKFFKFF